MTKLFIFDLDDTLISTNYKYLLGYAEAIKFIEYFLGREAVRPEEIVERINSTDSQALKNSAKPYALERFPKSICTVFGELCNEKEVKYAQKDMDELARIVTETTFSISKDDIMDGAYKTLDFLTERGDELVLLTKGEYDFQMEKIKACALDRWFSRIFITETDKSPNLLNSILEEQNFKDKDRAYSVGNYFRSDIKPALEAGIKGIYIPNGTWKHDANSEGLKEALDSGRVIQLKRLSEIIEIYSKL